MKVDYEDLRNLAVTKLGTFTSTSLCGVKFSTMNLLKIKLINVLSPEHDLHVDLSNFKPRFENSISSKQGQFSH
jgi:hypothetical protein